MAYRIPFNRPTSLAAADATTYLVNALARGQLAGNGPDTRSCESILQRATGAGRALLTSSCTAALEMSALLLDAQPEEEVIVPSFTFVSTANAFAMRGLRPVFADCRPDTFNVDARTLAPLITARTRAIVVMHYGGVACDMDDILGLARQHGLVVIEDNAHGLFGTHKGRALGSLGALATQSFHETKNVTCGEGGALLVNDPTLVDRAEVIREKGTNRSQFFRGEVDKYTWVDFGSNYLPSELQASFLRGQLECSEVVQQKRAAIWRRYHEGLTAWAHSHDVRLPHVPPGCEHPSHLYYVLLPTGAARSRLIEHLKRQSILAVFHYVPLHTSPMGLRMGGHPGGCPVAEDISARLLRLPFFTDLSIDDQGIVLDAVCQFTV
jgi:dTDP-4-amino-4,6-dideoxygalactose transaminase